MANGRLLTSSTIYMQCAVAVVANLVTLPVEINASTRAKDMLVRIGCGSDEEVEATDKVLNAAALTYVASLMVSLAYFLRFLLISFVANCLPVTLIKTYPSSS